MPVSPRKPIMEHDLAVQLYVGKEERKIIGDGRRKHLLILSKLGNSLLALIDKYLMNNYLNYISISQYYNTIINRSYIHIDHQLHQCISSTYPFIYSYLVTTDTYLFNFHLLLLLFVLSCIYNTTFL